LGNGNICIEKVMTKKNTTPDYTSNMQTNEAIPMQTKVVYTETPQRNNNDIVLSPSKIISGVVGSLLVGAILGGIAFIRVSDSTAIKATVNAVSIEELKKNTVSQAEFNLTLDRLGRIETKLDRLLER